MSAEYVDRTAVQLKGTGSRRPRYRLRLSFISVITIISLERTAINIGRSVFYVNAFLLLIGFIYAAVYIKRSTAYFDGWAAR